VLTPCGGGPTLTASLLRNKSISSDPAAALVRDAPLPLAREAGFCLCGMYHSERIMYVDPGAGSLVLQLILGGIAGALVTLKVFWRRLRARVGKSADAPTNPTEE
jgi:hypothetical protein